MFQRHIRVLGALFLSLPVAAAAHEIPRDVTAQLWVQPQGQHLYLLVRVPLKAMRDINFPQNSDGFLDLARSTPLLPGAARLWVSDFIEIYENKNLLHKPQVTATRISLPSDRSFESYQEAFWNLNGPALPETIRVAWDQTFLDSLFDFPIQSQFSKFSIHPGLARLGLRVLIALRFLPPSGNIRAFEFVGDPGIVQLDPTWHQAAFRFVDLGFLHIVSGTDHVLFLFCLVIPFRRLGALIPIVTAFTVAHSITLFASAYHLAPDFLWFPPLIETLIAASIVYMALENILGAGNLQRRWMMAFGFGLVHGFGFSFALREAMQFAGSHLLASLLAFNVGVEFGQLLLLILLISALQWFLRAAAAERTTVIVLSAIVAHTGWHWMLDRWFLLTQYRIAWPVLDATFLAEVLRLLLIALLLAGLLWLMQKAFRAVSTWLEHSNWKLFAQRAGIHVQLVPQPLGAKGKSQSPDS
jgi:hypothetical protein